MEQNNSDNRTEPVSEKEDASLLKRVVRSEEILRGESEILIRHGSEIYHLRVTRAGKLILTK